jgi:peptidoglycan/LPS O-acetylase OafA/YrhL
VSAKQYLKEIFEKNEKHDPVIDAIRAISVLSIIAFHVMVGIIQVYDHEKAKQYILDMPSVLQPLWHGEKGVDAFFLLSALVIGIPFFRNIDNFGWKTSKDFFKKKFLRIYPLFFTALCLYTVAQWSYFGEYFFSNLLFINNLIPGQRGIIPVGWFLTVEMQYFALTPLLFLGLRNIKARGLALTLLFLFSIGVCAMVLRHHSDLYMRPITDLFLASDRKTFSDLMGRYFYEANLTRFGPFVIGFLLAYLKVYYSETLAAVFKKKLASALALIISISLILIPITIPLYDPQSWFYTEFSTTLNFWTLAMSRQLFALGVFLLILGCWYSTGVFSLINSVFKLRIWKPLSSLSFPIYLFHFPFIGVAAVIIFGTTNVKEIAGVSFLQGFGIFLLATALTFLFSIPFHLFIERRFLARDKKQSNQPMV